MTGKQTFTIAFLACAGLLSVAGCDRQESRVLLKASPHSVELLGFAGCPNTPAMRDRLVKALELAGYEPRFTDIDLEALAPDDPRRGYAAPTILVGSADLFDGEPSPGGHIGCRVYPEGLPDAEQIRRRIFERLGG